MEFWSNAPILPILIFAASIALFVALAYYIGGKRNDHWNAFPVCGFHFRLYMLLTQAVPFRFPDGLSWQGLPSRIHDAAVYQKAEAITFLPEGLLSDELSSLGGFDS